MAPGVLSAAMPVVASIFNDLEQFGTDLSNVHLLDLAIGSALFIAYLSTRALAYRNILSAAYPDTKVPFLKIWGAYLAAYGFNNVIPARGGDVLKVYLSRVSIEGSTYPTIGAGLLVEAIFDLCAGALAIVVAVSEHVFPKPPSWVSFNSFDVSFLVSDGRRTLFIVTAVAVLLLTMFSLVALRVRMFWARVRQGFAVLRDRRLYFRTVWGVQFGAWLIRCTAFYFFLKAFGMPATVLTVLLVLSANAVAAIFPFTPGGAGVLQALQLQLLGGRASAAEITAYGVGAQATIAIISLIAGFAALFGVFRIRSFGAAIREGREHRAAEQLAKVEAGRVPEGGVAEASSDPLGRGRDDAVTGPTRSPAARAHVDELADSTAVRPGSAFVGDDWLSEELAPDQERAKRRAERARWRRRKS